jgi:hypothetical protein
MKWRISGMGSTPNLTQFPTEARKQAIHLILAHRVGLRPLWRGEQANGNDYDETHLVPDYKSVDRKVMMNTTDVFNSTRTLPVCRRIAKGL